MVGSLATLIVSLIVFAVVGVYNSGKSVFDR
jgi:hypothetical protein